MTLVRIFNISALAVTSSVTLVLGCSPPALSEIYQWRDAEGKVHFSDRRPEGEAVEEVSGRATEINIDSSNREQKKLKRVFSEAAEAEKHYHEQHSNRDRQWRQRQCTEARRRLSLLQGPVYFTRADGSTYTISEAERARRAAEFERVVRQNCGS